MNGSTELDEFRNQWKHEVQRAKSVPLPADSPFATPPSSPPFKPSTVYNEEPSEVVNSSAKEENIKQKQDVGEAELSLSPSSAIDIYRSAIDMERKGQLGQGWLSDKTQFFPALLHYRRAFKLDPDIDKTYRRLDLLEQASGTSSFTKNSSTHSTHQCDPLVAAATADGSDIRTLLGHPLHEDDNEQLITPNCITMNGKAVDPLNSLIQEFIQQDLTYIPIIDYKTVAIAKLPDEILVQVLGHLILHSVSTMPIFAMVCKRFFLATRSASLWRHACEHIFRAPTMTLDQSRLYQTEFVKNLYDGYWLRMFIERPRLRYDGVYISVCQYIRPGRSDTNAWTQPVHLVTYYRYLRFFPDGTIVKYLSTDEPTDVIRLLTPDFSRRQVFHGKFCLDDNNGQVAVEMRDKTRPRDRFNMLLYIKSTSRGRHNKLGWLSYTSKKDHREDNTTYDLNLMRPYFFSVVRSYRKQYY